MSKIPTHCFFIQLIRLENILRMLGDGAASLGEQHADQLLRQPDRFLRHADFDAVLARLPGEDEELGGAVVDLEFSFSFFH